MNNRHPWQLKKSKSWGPFWSYQINSTANPAHLPQNGPNGLNWQCYLAGSSKTAPRILIFSIAMGADHSFEVKNIKIWVPAFFKHNNSAVATLRKWFGLQDKINFGLHHLIDTLVTYFLDLISNVHVFGQYLIKTATVMRNQIYPWGETLGHIRVDTGFCYL